MFRQYTSTHSKSCSWIQLTVAYTLVVIASTMVKPVVSDDACEFGIYRINATAQSKELTNPRYPEDYDPQKNPPSSNQCWLINSVDGNEIEVEIEDLRIISSSSCDLSDVLEIYDGGNVNAAPLASYCGPMEYLKIPTTVRSSQQSMLIRFHADNDDFARRRGFKLRYYTKTEPSPDLVNATICSGRLIHLNSTTEVQYLEGRYSNHLDCRWQFESDSLIQIEFLDVDLVFDSANPSCPYDYVQVFDGPNVYSRPLGRFCKGLKTFLSSQRFLSLEFISNYGNNIGFKLKYWTPTSVKKPFCDGMVHYLNATSQFQYLTSPGYPNPFPSNVDCEWVIQSDNFTSFEVLNADIQVDLWDNACSFNSLEFFDGPNIYSKSLRKVCFPGTSMNSSGQYLTVKFKTGFQSDQRGFKLRYWNGVDKPDPSGSGSKDRTDKPDPSGSGSKDRTGNAMVTCFTAILVIVVTTLI